MRGIAAENKAQLHYSKIREIWNRHYRGLDRAIRERGVSEGSSAHRGLVRKWILDARDEVDYLLAPFFTECVRRLGPAREAVAGRNGTRSATVSHPDYCVSK